LPAPRPLPFYWDNGVDGQVLRASDVPRLHIVAPVLAYVLLYRGAGPVAAAIRWQTRGAYAHVALLVPDEGELACGYLYEARPDRGVVRRYTSLYRERERGATVLAVAAPLNRDALLAFAARQVGKPYDFTMVCRFVSRQNEARKSSGKWFCSELVFAALAEAGVRLFARTEPWEVSPALLARSPLLVEVE